MSQQTESPFIFTVIRIFCLICAVVIFAPAVKAAETLGLTECYNLAVQNSEAIAVTREEMAKIEAKFQSIVGHITPKINVEASEEFQDSSGSSDGSSVSSSFTRRQTPSATVTLSQPIFHGFKDFHAMKAQKAKRRAQGFQLDEARRDLFLDVATSFYTVIKLEKDIATTRQMMATIKERINALNERIRLGKSRESEKLSYETELALLEAELASDQGDLVTAYEVMSYLTGLSPHPRLVEKKEDRLALSKMETLVAQSRRRSDVLAAKEEVTAAQYTTKYYKAEFFPGIDLGANYYAYRTGFLKDIKWDATISLTLPVFNYTLFGDLRQAKREENITRLELTAAEKLAGSEVRQQWAKYQAAQKKTAAYEKATSKASRSHALQVADYELGLVTNLEVLQAQKTWLEAMRLRNASLVALRLAQVELLIAAGVTP